jgi:uncharacterized membrane protein YhiD involved in acid resistance
LSILAAFLCGTIVGIEREKGHKPAGLRTQILATLLSESCFRLASSWSWAVSAGWKVS